HGPPQPRRGRPVACCLRGARTGCRAAAHRRVPGTAARRRKIRVPKEIINKPGKLDPWDWVVIRRHTLEGETMLRQVGGRLAGIGRIVRSSHERDRPYRPALSLPDALA